MVICSDGSVSLCCYDWNELHEFGNLEKDSIKKIWNSYVYKELRAMHEKDCISDDYICKECDFWKADYLDEHVLGKIYKGKNS